MAFLAAFGTPEPPPPAPRSGGPRGVDVASSGGRGSLSAGAALYRERHRVDEAGNRPAKKPVPTGNRNPLVENRYTWSGDWADTSEGQPGWVAPREGIRCA
ncbi:hypothetical protein GCM10018791_23310 [Streptomyces zaomyceticus]|nr:hypothetical protein GCM10018791_23310 [Streptomyces zaomyceticus]